MSRGTGGLFILVPWGARGQGGFYFRFFHLTPKTMEAIIDATDTEFAIPGGC